MRHDGFPWNHHVYTTVAASVGLNYATRISPVERNKSGGTSRLLHYFSPGIAFARPEGKKLELVLRLHHRSGAFGLCNGACLDARSGHDRHADNAIVTADGRREDRASSSVAAHGTPRAVPA